MTTSSAYAWRRGTWSLEGGLPADRSDAELPYHVVAYDFGVKRNILRMLADRGCRLTVVPAQTPASEVLAMQPDGVFLSNGPGDPENVPYTIASVRTLMTKVPIFGICLGHQLLALAADGLKYKLKFGHHGGNQPVKDLETGELLPDVIEHCSGGFEWAADNRHLLVTGISIIY